MANSGGSISGRLAFDVQDAIAKMKEFGKTGEAAMKQVKDGVAATDVSSQLTTTLSKITAGSQAMIGTLQNVGVGLRNIKPAADVGAIGLGSLLSSVSHLTQNFGGLGALTGGGFIASFLALSKSTIDSAVNIERAAHAAGLTTDQYQALSRAAKQSGLDQDSLNTALRRFTQQVDTQGQAQFKNFIDLAKQLSQQIGGGGKIEFINVADFEKVKAVAAQFAPLFKSAFEAAKDPRANLSVGQIASYLEKAAQGAGDLGEKFRSMLAAIGGQTPGLTTLERLDQLIEKNKGDLASLGISLIDLGAKIKEPGAAFREFLDRVSKAPNVAEIVTKTFGRGASKELIDLIKGGTQNLDAIQAYSKEHHLGFSDAEIEKAKEAKKAIVELDESLQQLKNDATISWAPVIGGIAEFLSKSIEMRRDAKQLIADKNAKAADDYNARQAADAARRAEIAKQNEGRSEVIVAPALRTSDIGNFDDVKKYYKDLEAQAARTAAETKAGFSAGAAAMKETTDTAVTAMESDYDRLLAKINEVITAQKQSVGTVNNSPGAGAGAGADAGSPFAQGGLIRYAMGGLAKYAGGGHIRGPGTGTSDSIVARLANGGHILVSNGEYINDAKTVSRLGVPFFRGLKSFATAPRAAAGGFVDKFRLSIGDLNLPRFAAGGLPSFEPSIAGAGMHPVTIDMGRGRQISGLFAPPNVVADMRRAAVDEQLTSGGRKPSHYA